MSATLWTCSFEKTIQLGGGGEFSCSCMSITEFVQLLFASNYYAWPDRVSLVCRPAGLVDGVGWPGNCMFSTCQNNCRMAATLQLDWMHRRRPEEFGRSVLSSKTTVMVRHLWPHRGHTLDGYNSLTQLHCWLLCNRAKSMLMEIFM